MRMKCACVQGTTTSYERLPNVVLGSDEGDRVQSVIHQNRELSFYNDDGSYQTVLVERDLCASDLCLLLALKNSVARSLQWTLVEHWVETGLERCIEDHEKILEVYRFMENSGRQQLNRFVFRKDFRKYEFFLNPRQFFPVDMIDFPFIRGMSAESADIVLQNMLSNDGQCLRVVSNLWLMDTEKRTWSRTFLILREGTLYLTVLAQTVQKLLRHWKHIDNRSPSDEPISPEEVAEEWNKVHVVGMVAQFNIYTTLNAKNQQRAPTEFGITLRSPDKKIDADSGPGLLCLACDTERTRSCWVTAMRLAKYGKQLKENYKAFRNKQADLTPPSYNSLTVPNESVRSRVAMDFTGSVGRIVEDPREVRAIAAAEGYNWNKRWRANHRMNAPASAQSQAPGQGLESGVHITQPWFHSGMTRDQATQLVNRHGTVDGVFLVRESRSNPGSFVLTFRCGGKVIHNQIQPMVDPVREVVCYTLDNGVTKFYDLLQLIEFYQLNAGCLPTRLTHYLVQSPTGPIFADKPSVHNSPSPTKP